jgi:hypothetical protein
VGAYVCTASLMNVTTAMPCLVSLGEPPSVTLRPEDQYLAWPGETAYFRVRVSGRPHPSVEWYHDTPHGVTERIQEDRRHAISASGSLVVMDTTLEDMGQYHAFVSNGAGSVAMAASLEFFFTTPCRQECRNGGTCYQTHYCHCQTGFYGQHCQSSSAPTVSPTDQPPTQPPLQPPDTLPPDSGPHSGSGDSSGYSGYTDTESGDSVYYDLESGDSDGSSGYYDRDPGNSDYGSVYYSGDETLLPTNEGMYVFRMDA